MDNIFHKNLSYLPQNYRSILAWCGVFILFYIVGLLIPEGYDWKTFFSRDILPSFWTPWTPIIYRILKFPLLVALSLTAIVFRTFQYNRSPLPAILAVISLPTLWLLHLGNLDGLVLVGIILLPLGTPLVLMKPQLAIFSIFAKKTYLISAIVWLIISLIFWGFWPMNLMDALGPERNIEWPQDIALFPWGLLVALPLAWLSRGDEDLLMTAGSFITPYLIPYHFVILMPALGRMKPAWMISCWLLSWSPLIANWIGPLGWHMGNIFALVLWFGLYFGRNQDIKMVPNTAALKSISS